MLVNEGAVFIHSAQDKWKFTIQMRKFNELNAQSGKNVVMCQFGSRKAYSKHSH